MLRGRTSIGPFRNLRVGRRHIHHFVPGIVIAFAAGAAAILTSDEQLEPWLAVPFGAGMGLSILSEMAIQADHRVLTAKDGFAPIDRTEVALVAAPNAGPATLRLADRLAEFCETVQKKAA